MTAIRTWGELLAHYEAVADRGPALAQLAELVRDICDSRYVDGLYAWTSMDDLCIVPTPVSVPHDGPRLVVSPRAEGGLELRYLGEAPGFAQWQRVVPDALQAYLLLEESVEQLGWVSSRAARPPRS